MTKSIITLAIIVLLGGCATTHNARIEQPVVTKSMMQLEFESVPGPAAGRPISVAVYSFQDKTGQRRPQANIASLSTAITQGAETFLIKALSDVGRGQWFDVVERVGIDNLTKERLIIRQMREAYEGGNAKPLMPMQFAGMIIEGGIIGYDSSTKSGGAGARWLGIGASTQYSEDIVTVSLRAVSVNTGKVLTSVTVQKTILSSSDSVTALKFFDAGTKAFEGELGMTINEPGTYAVKAAIEMAVLELIKEGQRKGIWEYKTAKIEEKSNELVQSQTPKTPTATVTPIPAPDQPVVGAGNGASKEVGPIKSKAEEVKAEPIKETVATVKKVVVAEVKNPAPITATPLFGRRQLKEDTQVYAEESITSTRKWWFKKGTVVNVVQPGIEGWFKVTNSDLQGGWIQVNISELEPIK